MTTQSNVVATSAASQSTTQETTSVNEQINRCNRLVEIVINKNCKLEKRVNELEMNFITLCITIIVSLIIAMIIFYK